MPTFQSDVATINYVVEGSGPPIVLLHGFAGSIVLNWRMNGMIDALLATGRQVVALDCRGHGESSKPHDPAAYADFAMDKDVIRTMDHVGVTEADVMGYSMGSHIAARLLLSHPKRFRSAVLGGVGNGLLTGAMSNDLSLSIARALEADDPDAGENMAAVGFRKFADFSGNDRFALAAVQRAPKPSDQPPRVREITRPVLVVVGAADFLVGKADELAAAIPGARLLVVEGDHLTTTRAPAFLPAVTEFLSRHSPVVAKSA